MWHTMCQFHQLSASGNDNETTIYGQNNHLSHVALTRCLTLFLSLVHHNSNGEYDVYLRIEITIFRLYRVMKNISLV